MPELGEASGTAHIFGTGTAHVSSGKAYAKGTGKWGLSKDQPNSLVSELKPEILLRDGEYHLIEEPTIMDLKKDDIIFNGEQTEDILKHGDKGHISHLERLSSAMMKNMFGKAYGNGTSQQRILELLNVGMPNDLFIGQPKLDAIKPLRANTSLYNRPDLAVTIGDIHVHGVQNVNGLADQIINHLPNTMLQKLNKK